MLDEYNKHLISPIRFEVKKFYPMSNKQTIFEGCKLILEREKQGLYEYEIDGLIFTHEFYGVGSDVVGKAGPKTKITWEHSFKWKPPHYNTIDFLVTTLKSPNGEDITYSVFEDGISANSYVQFNQYKMLELRCGFSEKMTDLLILVKILLMTIFQNTNQYLKINHQMIMFPKDSIQLNHMMRMQVCVK